MFQRLAKSRLLAKPRLLAKSGLADFRRVQSRRTAPGLRQAFAPFNDNLPSDSLRGLRRPAVADKRRAPTRALTCRWFHRNGRLECRWLVESDEEVPIAGVGILSTDLRVSLSVKR
jgi:hypothetical protein